jgi:hypothetical protein
MAHEVNIRLDIANLAAVIELAEDVLSIATKCDQDRYPDLPTVAAELRTAHARLIDSLCGEDDDT